MKYSEKELLQAVSQSFQSYKAHGARSTAKLKPLHHKIAQILSKIWGKDYETHYLGDDSKELKIEGKYYPKDVDISITCKQKPVFCLGIKFVTSNYKQNANNYFEGMMGETANIQAVKDLPYAQLIILRYETPYYLKNETNVPRKIEVVNKKDLSKYLKLMLDSRQAHRPDMLGILLINIDEQTGLAKATEMKKYFDSDFLKLFEDNLSLANFFNQIENYARYLKSEF
jgi:hypothetical protein